MVAKVLLFSNLNVLIFLSFLLALEWLYLISIHSFIILKPYFSLLFIALGTCTRWAKWDGPTQGCSYPRIRGQPGKILMTLDLISDSNALSTLVSNWLIHMNWAVSICRLSQYYTKRASPEPPYLQRGIKQCAWVVCSPLSRCYVPGVQIVSAGEKLTKTKKRGKTRGGKGLIFLALAPPPPRFPGIQLNSPPRRALLPEPLEQAIPLLVWFVELVPRT